MWIKKKIRAKEIKALSAILVNQYKMLIWQIAVPNRIIDNYEMTPDK